MSNQKFTTLATGFALFSMFFGAGNVVFPLLVGYAAGDKTIIAMVGLSLTAVIMPILGLIAMILFKCNYQSFFERLGKGPGIFMVLLSMALIGPFLGIPRTISVAYSTFNYEFPNIFSPFTFSLLFSLAAYFCTVKKTRLVSIVGTILTPVLLFLLLAIIVAGILSDASSAIVNTQSTGRIILYGIQEGYNTLDLVAALFFAGIIMFNIKEKLPENKKDDEKYIAKSCINAGIIGGSLLALVYLGIAFVSGKFAPVMQSEIADGSQLLAALSSHILGHYAAVVAAGVVLLACFTTAISLVAVTVDVLRAYTKNHPKLDKIFSDKTALILTLIISFLVSLLGFNSIMSLVAPAILICYPVYIALSLCNIADRLKAFNIVKLPAVLVLLISIFDYFG